MRYERNQASVGLVAATFVAETSRPEGRARELRVSTDEESKSSRDEQAVTSERASELVAFVFHLLAASRPRGALACSSLMQLE